MPIHLLPSLDLHFFESSDFTEQLRFGLQPVHCGTKAPVHFRQGDLDGACGPCAASIALACIGFPVASDLMKAHKASAAYGRALKALSDTVRGDLLITKGTNANQLRTFVSKYSKDFTIKELDGTGAKFLKNIRELISIGCPLIMSVPGHWTVGVGFELDEDEKLRRLFLLDPGTSAPTMGYWNGTLERVGVRGAKFNYVLGSHCLGTVDLDEAWALWPVGME